MLVPWLYLRARGYETHAIGYRSRRATIEAAATQVASRIPRRGDRRVHFLTHSLGGLVAQRLIVSGLVPLRGRTVMLAPPNRGSRLAARLSRHAWYVWATGPAGQQLAREAATIPLAHEIGIIAGNRPTSPFALLLDGPSDGTVRVEETRIEGMADFLVVPRGHTFIMNSPRVLAQAAHFFEHGRFSHPPV